MNAPHEGEQLAHARFGADEFWRAHDFNARFLDALPPNAIAFVESLPFFFIATSNRCGECDCSFRSRELDPDGKPYSLLHVPDSRTLLFPDYRGNRMFSSLGNMLVNPHIGMLFIDFETQSRLRVNGQAQIIDDARAHAVRWPLAQRYIQVEVQQVFANCNARIPRMTRR